MSSYLEDLPDEIIIFEILQHLSPSSWASLGRTCSRMRQVTSYEPYWNKRCHREFGTVLPLLPIHFLLENDVTWRRIYSAMSSAVLLSWQPQFQPKKVHGLRGKKITRIEVGSSFNSNSNSPYYLSARGKIYYDAAKPSKVGVPQPTKIRSMSSGRYHNVALGFDNTVWYFDDNLVTKFEEKHKSRIISVVAGDHHISAILWKNGMVRLYKGLEKTRTIHPDDYNQDKDDKFVAISISVETDVLTLITEKGIVWRVSHLTRRILLRNKVVPQSQYQITSVTTSGTHIAFGNSEGELLVGRINSPGFDLQHIENVSNMKVLDAAFGRDHFAVVDSEGRLLEWVNPKTQNFIKWKAKYEDSSAFWFSKIRSKSKMKKYESKPLDFLKAENLRVLEGDAKSLFITQVVSCPDHFLALGIPRSRLFPLDTKQELKGEQFYI